MKRHGRNWAEVEGTILFKDQYTLEVREIIDFSSTNLIRRYGYAVKKCDEIQFWYDSQEHPNDPSLQITHPHPKHISLNIKHHRIPAKELSFLEPNLPFLINEIVELITDS